MTEAFKNSKPKSMQVEAIITRADGTVENLGVIQYWHKNPVIHFWVLFKLFVINVFRR